MDAVSKDCIERSRVSHSALFSVFRGGYVVIGKADGPLETSEECAEGRMFCDPLIQDLFPKLRTCVNLTTEAVRTRREQKED